MAVVAMQKFSLCALEEDRDDLLKQLQKKGRLHLTAEQAGDLPLTVPSVTQEKTLCEKKAQAAASALSILDEFAPADGGLFASFAGKEELSYETWQENSLLEEQTLAAAEKLQELQKSLIELNARELRLAAVRETLVPWKGLELPLSFTGTRSVAALPGTLPGAWTEGSIELLLAGELPDAELHEVEVISVDSSQTCLLVLAQKEELPRLEEVLRKKGFARPLASSDKLPAEEIEALDREAEEIRAEKETVRQTLASYGDKRKALQFCYDDNILKAGRQEALGKALSSGHVLFMSGYLPTKDAAAVKKLLEEKFVCEFSISDPDEKDEPPVLLSNNALAAPTEDVLGSYGLPSRGEVDPTSIMAFCYYFLFGLMLSDAGYGLVMALGCFILVKKFPKMEKGMRNLMTMFGWCGVSTVFWGVMFGGYFGDAIPVIARVFFHTEVTVPALWLNPLDEPMKLLIFCFLFGIIHLFIGLGIKGYMCLRDKEYLDFFAGVLSWYMFLIGLILMLLPTDIFASINGAPIPLPDPIPLIAKILALTGAFLIVFFSAHRRKNFALRIAFGAYELYGCTSWLSDILSYSRLLALGLATGVIAQVFNQMAEMFCGTCDGFFSTLKGVIIFTAVFLVGHTLNLAINVLGAYVHTNRLQYVEFFGKFYDGGGEAYAPLSAENTKYYHLEDN